MRMTEEEYADFERKRKKEDKATEIQKPVVVKKTTPNKTELEYKRILQFEFPKYQIIFQGLRIMLNNGHRYTPDWIVQIENGILCVEVKARGKNGFRQPSYQAAKLFFDQCRLDWHMFSYRWAEKHMGVWNVKDF